MFCCSSLADRIESAGSRGLSIVIERAADGFKFLLQSRGVAYEDVPKLRPMPIDIHINVAQDVGLGYCPWCGRRLQELVTKNPDGFADLATRHEKFIAVPIAW